LPDAHAVLHHLRRSVVRRARAAPRGGTQADLPLLPGAPVVSALRTLPARQREVVVLRYFADLPEAEIAAATGLSPAAVRNHAGRAMSSLQAGLGGAGQGAATSGR
jgi:DNA-directed RNA polymerase specialized sigma24 family protein